MTDALLEVRGVSVHFGGIHALSDINFDVRAGSITGLIGPNGAGKTTLINVLSGLARFSQGELMWKGTQPRRWSLSGAARAGVSRTFQATRVFGSETVEENVVIGGMHAESNDVDHILGLLDLRHRRSDVAGSLPYGEARRLGVALALATSPEVLLLDEPGAGLTGTDLELLGQSISRIRDHGTTVVLVDHNMKFVMTTVDRVVVLEGGVLIADGDPEQVQADERVRAAYLGGGGRA